MGKRLLAALDGSPQSEDALAFATAEWPDATVVLLHVIDPVDAGYSATPLGSTAEEWYERERERADALLEDASDAVDGPVETRIEVGRPARTIVEVADDEGAAVDHVVVGSHGREGVSRLLLGSVAETVVRRSPVPVTVVR
jgi:nucleotide-binding universal stress UspA family protein